MCFGLLACIYLLGNVGSLFTPWTSIGGIEMIATLLRWKFSAWYVGDGVTEGRSASNELSRLWIQVTDDFLFGLEEGF